MSNYNRELLLDACFVSEWASSFLLAFLYCKLHCPTDYTHGTAVILLNDHFIALNAMFQNVS